LRHCGLHCVGATTELFWSFAAAAARTRGAFRRNSYMYLITFTYTYSIEETSP
jgi:hypothetical protein